MKNKIRTKHILVSIFSVAILILFLFLFSNSKEIEKTIYINNIQLQVEVADTTLKRIKGLSGKDGLETDYGMLFVFDEEDLHGIWMKDMNFPIDIMWIDEEFNIVDIKSNAEPESYPEVFRPIQESLYVVETVEGFLHANDIKIGQKVILKIF